MKLAKVNNNVFEIRHGVELTPVSMTLPENINENQWNDIGDQVFRLENASNWILGDWWAFGQHKYGSRKKWIGEQKARRSQVKSFGHLANCASVCRAIETSRRREVVSFEMHRELLGLKVPEQERFLDLIEAGEIKTHKELRAKVAPAKCKPHKKIPLLIVRMFLGTCEVEDPLSSWRIVQDQNLENHQTIVCTKCWTHSTGGTPLAKQKERIWIFACRCPQSERSAIIHLYSDNK
jgi:hypothetical protein